MKRRVFPLLAAGWLCLCCVHAVSASASAPPSTALLPALRLEQGFSLGVAVYAPTAAVFRLDQVIKLSHLPSSQLAPIAEQTRSAERDAYHASATILKQMGAPLYIVKPYTDAVQTLTASVVITDTARQHVANDSLAQMVWSTLDEADQIAPQDNGALAAWLKLSRGRNALWAYHLGTVYAVVDTPSVGAPEDDPLLDSTGALADAAPTMTAKSLIDALQAVSDQTQHHKLTAQTLKKLADAIADAFGPGPLTPAAPAPPAPSPAQTPAAK